MIGIALWKLFGREDEFVSIDIHIQHTYGLSTSYDDTNIG